MKTIFIFIITIICVLGDDNVFAICPPGYYSFSFKFTYEYSYPTPNPPFNATFLCPMIVNYCCRWQPYLKRVEIIIDEVQSDSTDCLNQLPQDKIQDFQQQLHSVVEYWITPCFSIPCPSN